MHSLWTWDWTPYSNNAHFGDNPVFDWVRVLCVVLGMLMFMAIGRVLVESTRRETPLAYTQCARFISLALADLSISLTEVAVVGTPATPRLVVNVLVNLMGFYGVRGIRQKQRKNLPIVTD